MQKVNVYRLPKELVKPIKINPGRLPKADAAGRKGRMPCEAVRRIHEETD